MMGDDYDYDVDPPPRTVIARPGSRPISSESISQRELLGMAMRTLPEMRDLLSRIDEDLRTLSRRLESVEARLERSEVSLRDVKRQSDRGVTAADNASVALTDLRDEILTRLDAIIASHKAQQQVDKKQVEALEGLLSHYVDGEKMERDESLSAKRQRRGRVDSALRGEGPLGKVLASLAAAIVALLGWLAFHATGQTPPPPQEIKVVTAPEAPRGVPIAPIAPPLRPSED